jgi:hypothetical protein
MTKPTRTQKEKALKPWIEFPPAAYSEAIGKLVHHSFKTVNTNAAAGGVRIDRDQALVLPYVSARTLLPSVDIRMDRWEGAARAKIYGQIDEVDAGRTDGIPSSDLESIRQEMEQARQTRYIIGGDHLSPRLRQILLPKGDGYVAISPIAAAGVSLVLRQELRRHHDAVMAERDTVKEPDQRVLRFVNTANFPIGGSNSQNAGGLIFNMQGPLVGQAPSLESSLREALSLFHKGFPRPPVSTVLMREYRAWRHSVKGDTARNMDTRVQHQQFLARFAQAALVAGRRARLTLETWANHLPDYNPEAPVLVSREVKGWSRGLIDPALRSRQWSAEMASVLARAIAAWKSQEFPALVLEQDELNTMVKAIEEALG